MPASSDRPGSTTPRARCSGCAPRRSSRSARPRPGPALRRGALVAVPVALALIFEFSFDWPSRGAIATAALVCGFTAMDAPAGPRALWQAAAAPLVGIAAALGVLSSQFAPAAVLAMGLIAAASGYLLRRHPAARLRRLRRLGRADDLPGPLPARPRRAAGPPLRHRRRADPGGLGGLRLARLRPRLRQRERLGLGADQGAPARQLDARLAGRPPRDPLRRRARRSASRSTGSPGCSEHGYWIPLTILFVLRPERDETDRRLVLRAVGTLLGLALATGLAVAFDGAEPWIAIVLSLSAALTFGLITVQYALFTAAITTYVVLLTDTLGEARFDAAGQRVIGTVVGILIAWLAFRIYPGPRRIARNLLASQPNWSRVGRGRGEEPS